MLLSPGAESHGFEPTPRDMITLSGADLFIYVGGHGDSWVHPLLASIGRPDMRAVSLMDLADTVELEEINYDEDFDGLAAHDEHDDHDHDDDEEYDEHVWTSPQNAIVIVRALTDILAEMDPDNAGFFRANAAAYIAELQELDAVFAAVAENAARRTVVFGDRFPFRYLTDSYDLDYFAAFVGCSAETQASPATIAFLIDTVKREDIPVVFHIEFSNRLIANVITEATGARLSELHSTHSVSYADFNAGVTYIDLMRRNAEILREALN